MLTVKYGKKGKMKKNLVLLAAVTIVLGAASVLAVDKSTATTATTSAAAPATDATAAPAADKTATAKKQTLCPKCNSKIDKKFYVDSKDGKRVYFCSSFCADKMKKDIAGAVSKLEADGITLDTADKKADKKKK